MSDSPDFKEIKDIENSEGVLISKTEEEREVTAWAKLKIIAALFVVGFAGYVAYWVQEPTELKTDVINDTKLVATQTLATQALPSQTIPPQTYLPQEVSSMEKINSLSFAQTSAQTIDTQNAESQINDELRPAAYPSLLDSGTVYLNNTLSAKAPIASKANAADSSKIVDSGPEVFIYAGIFVAILFFTRKKLFRLFLL